MSSAVARLVRCAVIAVAASFTTAPAFAQLPHPLPDAPAAAEFMPRFDWKMSAASLSNSFDASFIWNSRTPGSGD